MSSSKKKSAHGFDRQRSGGDSDVVDMWKLEGLLFVGRFSLDRGAHVAQIDWHTDDSDDVVVWMYAGLLPVGTCAVDFSSVP